MQVRERSGRFLFQNKGETNWFEADDQVVREKVTNAFQGRRKTAIMKRFKQIDNNSTDNVRNKSGMPVFLD